MVEWEGSTFMVHGFLEKVERSVAVIIELPLNH